MAEDIARVAWRRPIASLNYLSDFHVWRKTTIGFSHQVRFIDHLSNKKATPYGSISLMPNTLLYITDHVCALEQGSSHRRGKQPAPQWLRHDTAIKHCSGRDRIWEWQQ